MSNAKRIKSLTELLAKLETERFFGDLVLKVKDGQLVPHFDLRRVGDLDKPASTT